MREPVSRRLSLPDADATRAAGARLANAIRSALDTNAEPLTIGLSGDLGAGKTTFVGGLLEALGHAGPVRSPTYTLVEPYRLAGHDLIHCDLYRLRHPDELDDLGLRDLLTPGSVLLVEWPERAEGRLGRHDLDLSLTYAGEGRALEVAPSSERGQRLARAL